MATSHLPVRFPVSVKGVLFDGDRVLLLKNERNEWELPGGKLERGEEPATCCEREITEETGLSVQATQLVDVWIYQISSGTEVLIITYGCVLADGNAFVQISPEHKESHWFPVNALPVHDTPAGYIHSIRKWFSIFGNG